MTNNPVYVLDANVFMEAARRYYAFDFAPAFWEALVRHAQKGRVSSIDRVKQEIERGKDDLWNWARSVFHSWFYSTNQGDVIKAYQDIITWVFNQNQFRDTAKAEFANEADGWLVAYAKAKRCVVVTHEQYDPAIQRKIPIPNACKAFDVAYVDTFEMLRNLGVRFCLG